MKAVAVVTVAFAIASGGYLYSKKLDSRVRKLEKIIIMLSHIKTSIQFTADNVESIFLSISTSCNLSNLPFVNACIAEMDRDADFFTSWSKALNERENTVNLKNEDVALLLSFGSALGATDSAGQIQNCELHERLFKERLSAARDEKNTLSKPAQVVGLLIGVAVLIFFM